MKTKIYGWMFNTQYTPILIYLPYKKRLKLTKLLDIILKVKYCDLRFLFKVSGTLMHYSQINKIIKVLCIKFIKVIYSYIDLNEPIRKQLNNIIFLPLWFRTHFKIWKYYISGFKQFTIDSVINSYNTHLFIATDSTLITYGIYCNGYYISDILPKEIIGLPVHICEAWTVIQALFIFKKLLKNKNIIVYCDNKPTCDIMTKYWCKNLQWEPYLFTRAKYMMDYNCIIDVKHVAGVCNIFADKLSRAQINKFKQNCIKYNRPIKRRLYAPYFKFE